MNALFFAAVSFGLLAFLEKKAKEEVSLKNFSHLIKEGVEVFAASAFLAILGYWVLAKLPWRPIREGEFLIPLLLPLSYVWQQSQKKFRLFYLPVTGFSFFAVKNAAGFWDCLYFSALLAGLATLFQFLLEGLKSRLTLVPPPSKVGGVSFLFFVASLVALVLNAIPISWINHFDFSLR